MQNKLDIGTKGHWCKCSDHHSPIIFLRDPVSRFVSMYNYWKNGSEKFKRTGKEVMLGKYKHMTTEVRKRFDRYTLDEYIDLVKTNSKKLTVTFTWDAHYAPQTTWISPGDYSKTIVVLYEEDLWPKVKELLEYIQVPLPEIRMGKINVSKKSVTVDDLEPRHIDWIKQHYACDYELIESCIHHKTAFRKVI